MKDKQEAEAVFFQSILRMSLKANGCGWYGFSWEGGHDGEPLHMGDPIAGRLTDAETASIDLARATIKQYCEIAAGKGAA